MVCTHTLGVLNRTPLNMETRMSTYGMGHFCFETQCT
jgi:hypothetical protein